MSTHFSTVPVETARQKALLNGPERVRPLVLVVDDEPILTETLAAILNGSGLSALTARDAASALEMARLMPPDVLIADLIMPGMDGLELALQVRQWVRDCDVILFSGQLSKDETVTKLQTTGPDFVTLMKPVHPADLLDQVFRCLSQRGFPLLQLSSPLAAKMDEFPRRGGQMLQTSICEGHVILKHRSKPSAPAN